MISFDAVSFAYGERPVLTDFSFEIARGEFLGVLGKNGAGKSTLARLLLGLLEPQRGRVTIDGRVVGGYRRREFARLVAAVTQEEPLDFPFTALEVVLMGRIARLGPLGFERRGDVDAALAAMDATDVAPLADRPLYALSSGERKRVLLARALAQDPQVLVLDEPAAALDIQHQLAIFELLAERHRRGLTVVVVVHDLNLAAAYCRRLLLLRPGLPALAGPPDELLTPERVHEAFGVGVYVGTVASTGARFLVPLSSVPSLK